MTLRAIARALRGDLYDGGRRAVVPGPGHSLADRSVSLLLSGNRVIAHSFGRSTWTEVMRDLQDRGFVDEQGRLSFEFPTTHRELPALCHDRMRRAQELWRQAKPIGRSLALTHIRRRGVARPAPVSPDLRFHDQLPSAVYADRGRRRPALLAAVRTPAGDLCAVEVTYLAPNGDRASDLPTPRKMIGSAVPASAVRLDPEAGELLVAEGVFTTLSAAERFSLPGWALLSTRNLRSWSPPAAVRSVLLAADRGVDGQRSAHVLAERLAAEGRRVWIETPPAPFGDWNEACVLAGVRSSLHQVAKQ